MKRKATYVELGSTTMNPCDLGSQAAYVEAERTWLCRECGHPKRGVEGVEVRVSALARDPPLNLVNGTLLGIAYKPFLDRFPRSAVENDLHIGPVYGPDGKLLDWVTFHGRTRLILRGSKHVSHRICPNCNRDIYFAMGKKYLYPPPPSGVTLFESHACGLIVPLEVFETLDLGKWKRLSIDRLRVLDVPNDGLGELSC
jgi:hypothetical protein